LIGCWSAAVAPLSTIAAPLNAAATTHNWIRVVVVVAVPSLPPSDNNPYLFVFLTLFIQRSNNVGIFDSTQLINIIHFCACMRACVRALKTK